MEEGSGEVKMTSDCSDITINPVVVAKIQKYMNGSVYRETIENAAQYNSKLGAERTMRLPFLDSQTGVAQNHSNLWMEARQRLPGLNEGQIYTYPSKRWKKKRRQYLNNFMQPRLHLRKDPPEVETPVLAIESAPFPSSGPGPSIIPEEIIKEATSNKEEIIKPDWFYDEMDVPDPGEFEEPDPDSDYDYEESYSSKRKKKKATPKAPRQQNKNRRKITYDPITDAEKPFACDLCGARYKTRPGLTYHYTHSHKEKEDEEEEEMAAASPKRDEARRRTGGMPPPILHPQQPLGLQPPTLQPQQPIPPSHHMPIATSSGTMMPPPQMMHHGLHPPPPHLIPQQQPHHMPHQPTPIYHHQPPPGATLPPGPPPGAFMSQQQQQQQQLQQQQQPLRSSGNTPPVPSGSSIGVMGIGSGSSLISADDPNLPKKIDEGKPRVQPSPYCDFCLGDAVENKKSGGPEELVSCSDCGRSGHPTCLQFTANMIISVKKYRWQCIECKCCSICGTSDNDDQLLFCDDCDRGYHMYCLSPPLDAPPEGSWSCTLCLAEFHKK